MKRKDRLIAGAAATAVTILLSASAASAQPSTSAQMRVHPSRHPQDLHCSGGKESPDHKEASKVVCFRVTYHHGLMSDIRGQDGDEGKVKRASCSAPVNGKRTCSLTVEVNERR